MRDPQERLRDILDAITRIERYAAQGRDAFDQDELIQVWIVPGIPCAPRGTLIEHADRKNVHVYWQQDQTANWTLLSRPR